LSKPNRQTNKQSDRHRRKRKLFGGRKYAGCLVDFRRRQPNKIQSHKYSLCHWLPFHI